MSFIEVLTDDEDDDDEYGSPEFFEVFEAFVAAATDIGWESVESDEVLRVEMETEFGVHTLQIRINDDDSSVEVSVVYHLITVGVSESVLYKIINTCNDIKYTGTFSLRERTTDLIWHFAIILGDVPGITLSQAAHIFWHANSGTERIKDELLKALSPDLPSAPKFTINSPVRGNA